MSYLLDTNVVSETRRPAPNPNVRSWFETVSADSLFLSVMVVAEIRMGIEQIARRDRDQADQLSTWYQNVTGTFADRIIPVTLEIAQRWAQLNVPDRIPIVDGLLAATALTHDWTLVTRNTKDVARTGVRLLNPFEPAG